MANPGQRTSYTISNALNSKNQVLSEHGIVNIIDVSRNESHMGDTREQMDASASRPALVCSESNRGLTDGRAGEYNVLSNSMNTNIQMKQFYEGAEVFTQARGAKRRRLVNVARAGTLENPSRPATKNEKLTRHLQKKMANVQKLTNKHVLTQGVP